MRDAGWLAGKVEYFNGHTHRMHDLFGFCDYIAIDGNKTIFIQVTSGANHANRRDKILASPEALRVSVSPSRRIEIWSWRKAGARGKRKTWTLRREEITWKDIYHASCKQSAAASGGG
jgi:hypothetical protein